MSRIIRTIGEQRIESPRFPILAEESIFRYCVVDSRNRNAVAYPNPNNYNYELNQAFRDVVYCEILNSCIRPNKYNITNRNNGLVIVIDGAVYSFAITPGTYPAAATGDSSHQSVGEIVTTELGYLGGNIGLRYNSNQDRFYFYETGTPSVLAPYSVNMGESSVASAIGFLPISTNNALNGQIEVTHLGGPDYQVRIVASADIISKIVRAYYVNDSALYYEFLYDTIRDYVVAKSTISNFLYTSTTVEFITTVTMAATAGYTAMTGFTSIIVGTEASHLEDPCYLLLDIPELQRLEGNQTAVNRTFFEVPISTHYRIYDNTNSNISLYFNPPLPKLERIRVRFLDESGNLYDFGSRNEHSFTLGIRELNSNRQSH